MEQAARIREGKVRHMNSSPLVSDKIAGQIHAVRDSGRINMFDVYDVQREAHSRGFYELVLFLSGHQREYVEYILARGR